MITELTPEQEAQLVIYRKHLLRILSNHRTNRSKVEKSIKDIYRAELLTSPHEIHWFDSPLSMCEYLLIRSKRLTVVLPKFDDDWITNNVDTDLLFNIELAIFDSDVDHFTTCLVQSLQSKFLEFSIYDMISDSHLSLTRDFVEIQLRGQNQTTFARQYFDLIVETSWMILTDNIAYVSERHTKLNLDNDDLPHCEDGLAIGYPDGWGVYAWHGVRVPEYVIMRPDEITPDKIMTEANAEVARVMIERYGQDNFIRDGGFTIQQSDEYGDLYRVEFDNGDEPIVAVKVKDASSDREYFLYVPPHIRTAHEGVAWTFGYDNPSDYNPLKET